MYARLVVLPLAAALVSCGDSAAPRLSPAAEPSVAAPARALHFKVSESPWCLTLVDDAGTPVLEEICAAGPTATGALGFQTTAGGGPRRTRGLLPVKPNSTPLDPPALGWFHATEVISSTRSDKRYEAELATSDLLRRLHVVLEENEDDSVSLAMDLVGTDLDVEAVGIAFAADADEGFFGTGRRDVGPDLRGSVIENYVGEGPSQPEEYPVLRAAIPPWSIRQRPEDSYYPIPWALSSRGVGVSIENDETSYFRFATESAQAWSLEVEAPALRLRFFAGATPAGALGGYSAHYGRQPAPGAPYFFGPWFQDGQPDQIPLDEERGYVEALQNADAPISVAETHMHYFPCDAWVNARDGEKARTAMFNAKGLPTLAYMNPIVCTRYQARWNQFADAGALQQNALGQPYRYLGFEGGGAFPPVAPQAQIDFSNPAAEALYEETVNIVLQDGHRGWMEDFGENTPLDVVSHDGTPGEQMHNRYPRDYHCTGDRIARRKEAELGIPLIRFSRAGWRGAAPCLPVVWGGDPTVDWGYDGLETQITSGLTMGLSGVAMWGSDIGGYVSTFFRVLTPELLQRWIQFGAVSPVMRTKGSGQEYGRSTFTERPQIWEPEHIGQWRRWAALHTQLNPYLAAAHAEYRDTGMPIMRHHLLSHPRDTQARAHGDQYLFGPDLLAAPVYTEGATTRDVHLPAGDRWIHAWQALTFDEATTGLHLGAVEMLDGGQNVTLPAPLAELPLLIRVGAVLPMLTPDVRTLADTAPDPGVVKLVDRLDQMVLLAFPRGHTLFRVFANERWTSQENPGSWTLGIGASTARRYRLQASLATLEHPFIPCTVTVGAQPAGEWTYDAATRVLRADFTTSGGDLRVQACPALE